MSRRIKVRPGKPGSAAGMVVGIIFVILGLTVVIPMAGAFGVLWTLVALVITILNGVNVFTDKGVPLYEVNIDGDAGSHNHSPDYTEQLRQLKQLKDDGIITETEFNIKKEEILSKRW